MLILGRRCSTPLSFNSFVIKKIILRRNTKNFFYKLKRFYLSHSIFYPLESLKLQRVWMLANYDSDSYNHFKVEILCLFSPNSRSFNVQNYSELLSVRILWICTLFWSLFLIFFNQSCVVQVHMCMKDERIGGHKKDYLINIWQKRRYVIHHIPFFVLIVPPLFSWHLNTVQNELSHRAISG